MNPNMPLDARDAQGIVIRDQAEATSAHRTPELPNSEGAFPVSTGWESAISALEAEANKLIGIGQSAASFQITPLQRALAGIPANEQAKHLFEAAAWLRQRTPNT